ncbi:hypothetical protein WR25_03427 [Diploscapter pachys]|uniref:Peptidase M12A domain-containing protein n=1 Tax=Diploscapter pachys TaxID=2018661 RepID=A0A2A2J7H0_9BILA|nr:hypothetical protein WR25_03427 [Diploscapter pachys]
MTSSNNVSFMIYLLSIILILTRLFILTEAGHLATNSSNDRNIEPIGSVRDFRQTEATTLSARQNAGPSSIEIDPLNDFQQTQSSPQPYRENSDYGTNSAPIQSDLSQVPVRRDISSEASGSTSEPSTSSSEPEKKPFKEELMNHFELEEGYLDTINKLLLKLKQEVHKKNFEGRDFANDAVQDLKTPVFIAQDQGVIPKSVIPYMFEGDIFLTKEQAIKLYTDVKHPNPKKRERRSFINDPTKKWTNFPIKYRFHDSLDNSVIKMIIDAIRLWENATCVTFENQQEIPKGEDYLEFFYGQGDPFYQRTIGQRDALTFYDIGIINKAYCRRAKCGGILTADENWQTIESPGFPDTEYRAHQKCSWLIETTPGTRIEMQFIDEFSLICKDTCSDYVELKLSKDLRNTGIRGRRQQFDACNFEACPVDKLCRTILSNNRFCDGKVCTRPEALLSSRCNEPQCCPPYANVDGICTSPDSGNENIFQDVISE